jgi:predicted metal-dependent peptidase
MLAFNIDLTAEQRIQKAAMALNAHRKWVAFVGVSMIGDTQVVEAGVLPHDTAATNGRDSWYCREFIDRIRDSDLRFTQLHEQHHIALEHLTTWEPLVKIDPDIANMAMDHVINVAIMDIDAGEGFVTLPLGEDGKVMCLYDTKYRGMDTQQVFNILYKEKQEEGDGGESTGDGSGDGEPSDTGGSPASGSGGFDDHDWEGAKELSKQEKNELGHEVAEALRQGSMAAGKMAGSGAEVGFDKMLEPQVDWREVLRDFISATCAGSDFSTYARPNRRYMSTGVYMPSGVSQRVKTLVLAIDTSGSVSQTEISTALAEVKSICDIVRPEKVTILYWGDYVVRREDYDEHNMDTLVDSTKPEDGGGTQVECVPEYMREHGIDAQATIVFTDGYIYGGWGQWDVPVLWTVFNNKGCKPTVGKVCHINASGR